MIEGAVESSKSFLACRIPDLQDHVFFVDMDVFFRELEAYGGVVAY